MFEKRVTNSVDGIDVSRPVDDGATSARVGCSAFVNQTRFNQGGQVVAGRGSRQRQSIHDVLRRDLDRVHHQSKCLQTGWRRSNGGASLRKAHAGVGRPVGHVLTLRGAFSDAAAC